MEMGGNSENAGARADSPRTRALLRAPAAIVVRVALLWCIGWFFFVFHGLSFHLTPWSQALVNAMVKFVYPASGQADTTVLLFREENLTGLGTHYPVPYEVHGVILEELATHGPRAVFIDFAFVDRREGDDIGEFARKLCTLANKAEVYLAHPLGESASRGAYHEIVRQCPSLRPASPMRDDNFGVSGVLTYQRGLTIGQSFVPSAAFAAASGKVELPPEREALEIIWGNRKEKLNQTWMDCGEPSIFAAVYKTFTKGPLATKRTCPYTRTITVRHLLEPSSDPKIQRKEIVGEAIKDKTVFYGADFEFTGDRIDSPVYAEMAGVYLHAMAYDNLVSFKKDFKRAEHTALTMVYEGALLLLAVWLLVLFPREDAKPETRHDLLRKLVFPFWAFPLAFLAGATWGFDNGLLLLFLTYVFYRTRIARDSYFLLQTVITVVSALIAYFVFNLGPRNILSFLVFFEVVRHLQKWFKEKADEYFKLKAPKPEDRYSLAVWRAADSFFSLYRPAREPHSVKEAVHGTESKTTQA